MLVPPEVARELANPRPNFATILVTHYPFMDVRSPTVLSNVSLVAAHLDRGETEALSLALELHADFVLMDESDGRAAARKLGLIVTGVVGVLGRAKHAALIQNVRPLLDQLESGLGFFLEKSFKERSLRVLGE